MKIINTFLLLKTRSLKYWDKLFGFSHQNNLGDHNMASLIFRDLV